MSDILPGGYNDPNAAGNLSEAHRTGNLCIEPGCGEPAGTAWSPYWCFKHNVERIDGISASFRSIMT